MPRTTVDAQLAKLRKAREALEKKEKELINRSSGKVLGKIVALAKTNGITAAQIVAALKTDKPKTRVARKNGGKRASVAPKYRNPANAEQTWTGRGKSPLWAKALKEAGTLDTALIK